MEATTGVADSGAPVGAPAQVSSTEGGMLREWWAYRELFYFFCWRDIKVRYKQTVLGLLWAVLQPVITMIVFTVLFGRVAKLPSDGIPYPIFYYSGLLPWTYFSNAFSRSSNSLVTNVALVTKVYFPRELIPASTVLTHLFDLAISLVLMLVLMAWYSTGFGWELVLWPVLIMPLTLTAFGLGLWLSALNVKYRDIKHVIPFMVQVGMFVSPVVYPNRMIPQQFQWLYAMNPAVGVIEACRASVMPGREIDWALWIQALVVSVVVLAIGVVYFRRTERTFADLI